MKCSVNVNRDHFGFDFPVLKKLSLRDAGKSRRYKSNWKALGHISQGPWETKGCFTS
jgi:hypothetical protein